MHLSWMWIMFLLLAAMTLPAVGRSRWVDLDLAQWRPLMRNLRSSLSSLVGRTGDQAMNTLGPKLQKPWPRDSPFPCDVSLGRSPTPPEDVNKLRIGDFKIVGAMGDSLTCVNGGAATLIHQLFQENRGISWAAGGQGTWREFTTFANILRAFNPNLMGYSTGDSFTFNNASQFNIAEPAAISEDMPFMARQLVARIKKYSGVNFEKDWKVISILIGGNDMCSTMCYTKSKNDYPEWHRGNLTKTLRYLRDNMPRTFVNVVSVPPLKTLTQLKKPGGICWIARKMACSCIFGDRFRSKRKKHYELHRRWVQVEKEVAALDEFRGLKEFAVVWQPFSTNISIENMGHSVLAVDCFHMSQKGNAWAGTALYKNMLQRPGQKDTTWGDHWSNLICPKANDYVRTYDNSLQLD